MNKNLEISGQQDELRAQINAHLDAVRPNVKEKVSQIFEDILLKLNLHQIELENQNEELQRAQVALEEAKAHYVDLYDYAPVGYLTIDEEGIIQEINFTAANLIAKNREDILNQKFVNFISDDYKIIWNRHFHGAKQHCQRDGCELPFILSNGKTLYLHVNFRCLHIADSLQSIRIALTDVTERKLAEEKLSISAAAFEAQEGILVTDADKIILRVNKAFSEMTGFSAEEAIGKTANFLRSGLQDETFYDAIFTIVENEGYWQGELWNKRKNGEIFPVLETITAVKDAHSRLTHYVGTMLDITVQKHAEKVLLDARIWLETQVANSHDELDKIKRETSDVNAALNVLLRQRETDKTNAQIALSGEVEATVLPMLKKLKAASTGRVQSIRLIKILEENLQQLVTSYGRTGNITAVYQKLTPLETQVAAMIRQGRPTKAIASALNIAPGTVSIHRKHIRKKLNLDGKKDNLHSYLQSLGE